jgi:glutaredoxin
MGQRRTGTKSVVMYTRRGCCLCDDAKQLLEELASVCSFQLQFVDIDSDPEMVKRHGERVPVIEIDGKERFWGRINRVLVERKLR